MPAPAAAAAMARAGDRRSFLGRFADCCCYLCLLRGRWEVLPSYNHNVHSASVHGCCFVQARNLFVRLSVMTVRITGRNRRSLRALCFVLIITVVMTTLVVHITPEVPSLKLNFLYSSLDPKTHSFMTHGPFTTGSSTSDL